MNPSRLRIVLFGLGGLSLSHWGCGDGPADGSLPRGDSGVVEIGSESEGSTGADAGAGDSTTSDASNESSVADSSDVGTGFCLSFPSMPATRPMATNTGVPPGTVLSASGELTISVPGTVVDAKDVSGSIMVNANNVTIRNTKVHPATSAAAKGIVVKDGVTGTNILYSEIYTNNGGYVGIQASDATVCGNYLHGWENAMSVSGGMTIQANYIDRLKGSQASPHFDGIEIYFGGAPSKLWGNHIRMTDPSDKWLDDTGAINITPYVSSLSDVELVGNWMGGGSYTLYVDEQNGAQANMIKITNNRWVRNSAQFGTHLIRRDASVTVWSGNVFDDNGDAIPK